MLIIIQRAVVQYVKNIGVRNKTSHVNNKKIYKSRDLEIIRIFKLLFLVRRHLVGYLYIACVPPCRFSSCVFFFFVVQ